MTKDEFQQKYGIWQNNPDFDTLYNGTKQGQLDIQNFIGGNQVVAANDPVAQAYWRAKQYQKDQVFQNVQDQIHAPPPIDPRFQQLVKGQQDFAKQFRNSIPQLADSFMGQIAQNNKKNLAAEIDATQKNYNRRGLLYSTARLGAEQNAKEQTASTQEQQRYDLNTELNQTANQFDQNAINSGFQLATQGQSLAGENTQLQGQYLDMALQQQQQNFGAINQAFKGYGSALGYLNGLNKSSGTSGLETTPIPGAATGTNYNDYGGYGGVVG